MKRAVRVSFRQTSMVVVVATISANLGCGGLLAKEGYPTCGDGKVQCPDSPKTASKVVYHCAFDTGNGIGHGVKTGDFPVCLPANLNTYVATPDQLAAINAMSMSDYDKAIFDYGQQQVLNQIAGLAALDSNGSSQACSTVTAGLGLADSVCTETDPAVRDSFCENPANFVPVTCCPVMDSNGICEPNPCNGFVSFGGSVNPHACACNTLPVNSTECNIPAGEVVIPSPGSGDPPGDTSGMLQRFLSQQSNVAIDPTGSSAVAHLHFDDTFGFSHDDTQTSSLRGTVSLYGRPRPDGTASLLFETRLQGTDVHFHFSGVDVIGDLDVQVSDISIAGGSGDNYLNIDASGNGIFAKQTLALDLEATVDGQKTEVEETNDDPIAVHVDFASKTFSIPSFPINPFGADVNVTLQGTISNQPPTDDAGPPQTIECTSPTGANATLDGSASDPDADPLAIAWEQGPPVNADEIGIFNRDSVLVASSLNATVFAPFSPPALTTGYTLSAQDPSFQLALSQTTVTVQDTTPPVLTVVATPSCLWPPNHKLALYTMTDGLNATAVDPCDLNPQVEIVSVASDQPALGGGSGATPTDVVFGKRAFCVRSERDGTSQTPRHYTIQLKATDRSGNSSIATAIIVVNHDQGGISCANVSSDRIVDDGDPRCSEN